MSKKIKYKYYKQDEIELFAIQKGLCFFCDRPMPLKRLYNLEEISITKDHFWPKKINKDLKNNMVLCHKNCNQRKADRLPTEKEIIKFKEIQNKLKKRKEQIKELEIYYKNNRNKNK